MRTRPLARLAIAALAQACGGNLSTAGASGSGPADAGNGAADGIFTTGPIDASGAPTALVMNCRGPRLQLAFKLPCAVGLNPLNVTECYPLGGDSRDTRPILGFMLPLATMAAHLDEPIRVADFPAPRLAELTADGIAYDLTQLGTLTVSQVDTVSRAYVGRLQSIEFSATADGSAIVCSADDAPFWALPGSFL